MAIRADGPSQASTRRPPAGTWRASATGDGILVVGELRDHGPDQDRFRHYTVRVDRCRPEIGALRAGLAGHRPLWLVVGQSVDDVDAQALVSSARQVCPDLRLAMVGPPRDVGRCQRWLRRGCHVYLAEETPFEAMLAALKCAAAADVTIVDRAFYLRVVDPHPGGPVPSLTARQREVLGLVGRSLTNSEIAKALHVSENTIEFHVRRLLVRLGARNRMHAVRRASDLGLI
jgi:DNA-binding NarL/FixJ family response regulator